MRSNVVWFLVIFLLGSVASAFFAALSGSHSGEIAQALANLLGAALGGGIAVYAAYSQVQANDALRLRAEKERNDLKMRSGRLALCTNVALIGEQCLHILNHSSIYRSSPHAGAFDLIIEPISLASTGLSYGELSEEEVRLLMVFQEAIFEIKRIKRGLGYTEMSGAMYANLISRVEGACEEAADFLAVAGELAGGSFLEVITRLHVIRCD